MSKKPSDLLYRLIHGLTASEKRHFKQYLHLHGGKQSAIGKLFDAYNRQSEFDEYALKRSERYLSGFAQQKKQLQELLMRSLRAYHSQSNTDMKIRALLSDAELFRHMRLYDAAKQALKKAGKLARETENILMQAEVLRKTDELYFDIRERSGYETYATVLQQELALLRQYNELVQHKSIAKAGYAAHYSDRVRGGKQTQHVFPEPGSLPAKRLLLSGKMANALSDGKADRALQFARQHVQLIEKHPQLVKDYPYEYLKALSSQLVLEDTLSLPRDSINTIRKMRQLHRQPALRNKLRAFESHTFVYTYTTEFTSLVKQKKFADAFRLVPEITRGLAAHGNQVTGSERKVFFQVFAMAYLYDGNPQLAYRWSGRALNLLGGHRPDLDFSLLLIRILATYEKNDVDFLRTLLRKDTPLLEEAAPAVTFRKLFSELSAVLVSDTSARTKKEHFRNCLEKYARPAPLKKLKPVLQQFDLMEWLRSQVSGKTMAVMG